MVGYVIIMVLATAIVLVVAKRMGVRVVSPNAVLRRLELAGNEYSFRMTWLTSAWNPAGSSLDLFVMGKGHATYWLDEAGMVHLRYQPVDGGERHLTGPKPPYAPKQRVARIAAIGMAAAMAALIAGGAFIGFYATSPASGQRGDGAAVGAIAAVAVGCALASIARLIVGSHATRRDNRN